MFRLAPIFKSGCFSRFLPLAKSCSPLFSVAANSPLLTSDNTKNDNAEIDLGVLFESCTKSHLLKCLHAFLVVSGKIQNIFISTKLVNHYANLGDVSFSCLTFDQISNKNVFTWNSMVSAYVRCGHFSEALDCFFHFLLTPGIRPDFYTFPPVLKACRDLVEVKKIHCSVLKLGFEWDVFVAASLLHMYAQFGLSDVAHKLFDDMPVRDRGSWNAMISSYCQSGNATEALDLLDKMRLEAVNMDSVTVASILSVCAQSGDIVTGMLIHLYVIKHGLEFNLFVSNALINMYAKYGDLEQARKVFDNMMVRNTVSWNSIISAYEQNNDPITACGFFNKMQRAGTEPDLLTLVSLASIVAQMNDHKNSLSIHGFTMRRGWLADDVVIGNAIVDMYTKLGVIESACSVFEGLPVKDVISWNTLITGYAQNGLASEAIEVYQRMEECNGIIPNQGTWVSLLLAYSHVGAVQQGMKIHGKVIKNCLYMDVSVATCLIVLYGKCGRLDDAISLFYQIPRGSPVSWNAIISCHAVHGHGEKAINLFGEMLDEGVKPNDITFVSLLSACSHSGLVSEGQSYFSMMQEEYGIRPHLKHYGCMVDLFGRAGKLEKAYDFIKSMPLHPDASVWGALLGACRIHGNIELGSFVSDRLFEVDSEDVGYYVLMSNIYANVGKWEGVDRVRSLARVKGLKKTPGWSSIEVNSKVDVFYTGNRTHPRCEEIYCELRNLTAKMKSFGYVPDYTFVLQDVEDDEKEHILTSHSERLAIAFGIISTPPKTSIRIFKNLRVCGDCHNASKFISQITEREIIVRDSNRFHHFKDGICSCGDYW
ncbi:pentatricopeptide repeat-containing protein At4g33990-like [Mangifera indica]|uniref:pentatricopeptide repeat-containing protein At4g33990-like n=1 Tax=Mangifera indica TaxID=29780 RepID=UPI001CF9C946|nr:pentatricopeptide repeat-containing protein At4g33990-like [Mangifera indica]XP_044508061.1 pentatricopeptide repeat-containing protein At4g33990-like [Mangifera indica]